MNGEKINKIFTQIVNLVKWPHGYSKSPMEFSFEALQDTNISKPKSLKILSIEVVDAISNSLHCDFFICCLRGEIDAEDIYKFGLPVEWIEDIENKIIYSDMWSNHEKTNSVNATGFITMSHLDRRNLKVFTPCKIDNMKKIIPSSRRLRFQFYDFKYLSSQGRIKSTASNGGNQLHYQSNYV